MHAASQHERDLRLAAFLPSRLADPTTCKAAIESSSFRVSRVTAEAGSVTELLPLLLMVVTVTGLPEGLSVVLPLLPPTAEPPAISTS